MLLRLYIFLSSLVQFYKTILSMLRDYGCSHAVYSHLIWHPGDRVEGRGRLFACDSPGIVMSKGGIWLALSVPVPHDSQPQHISTSHRTSHLMLRKKMNYS